MIPYRSVLNALHDYVPGKSIEEIRELHGLAQVIKLASNENPLGASPKAREAYLQAVSELHLYPRGECPHLRNALSARFALRPEQLILGNGSDEILAFIALAYLEPGTEALSCAPTFSVYEAVTLAMGAAYRSIPLLDWKFDLEALAGAVTPQTRVVFVCNPNNPTGTWVGRAGLLAFLRAVPSNVLVVVDQAYSEFADDSDYSDLTVDLSEFSNLLLVRTFSKVWGLAGLRVGYAMGQPEVVSKLWKVKPPFDVNTAAQVAATAALDDREHLQKTLQLNSQGKAQLLQGILPLGLQVLPTQANFLAIHVGPRGPALVAWLESKGMIIRGLKNFGIPEWIRVTVGLEAENRRFLELLLEARQNGFI
jgi:histidinol-phosphate aminotransferase